MCIWLGVSGFYYTVDGLYAIRREMNGSWYIYRRGYSLGKNVYLGSFRLLKDAKKYVHDLYNRGVNNE
jgi:hypothetical protein